MNRDKWSRRILLLFFGYLSVSLCGCRNSPVLEQVVYEQDHEVDEENETDSIENEEDNEEQDEDLAPNEETDDSDSKRDQTRQDALYGDGSDTADQTYDSVYEEYADAGGTAEQNTSASTESEENTGSGENNETEDSGGNGSLEDGQESGTEYEPSDSEDWKQVVDSRGETVDVPVNVDSVTAVGEAAAIVEMLGGNGRLLASSDSFTGNSLAQSAFSTQGFSSVQTWWDGDGSGTISSANFQALLEAHPDVCFEISGQSTFSSEQIAALNEAEIAYVVLPAFTSIGNIESAVTIVGEVLGDRSSDGGTDAPDIASQYVKWAEQVVALIQGKGSEKSTLYISAWDTSAYWEIRNSTNGLWRSGYGVAISRKNASSSPLDECMKLANLTNEAVDNYYVMTLSNNYWLHYVSGGTGRFYYGMYLTKNSSGYALGSDNYPAVVVADSSIKEYIESDFRWAVYDWTSDAAGNTARGFDDGFGNIIPTTIAGEYEIYVNPTGLGSWTDGSVEAPLEAAWLSCKFQGGCTLDELRNMVTEFYSTFYHLDVDASSILGE